MDNIVELKRYLLTFYSGIAQLKTELRTANEAFPHSICPSYKDKLKGVSLNFAPYTFFKRGR